MRYDNRASTLSIVSLVCTTSAARSEDTFFRSDGVRIGHGKSDKPTGTGEFGEKMVQDLVGINGANPITCVMRPEFRQAIVDFLDKQSNQSVPDGSR